MKDAQHIVYTPHPGSAPEAEFDVLASVYSFILDHRAKRRAAEPGHELDSRDVVKESNGHDATQDYTEPS